MRDKKIDLLRFIALSSLIMAHIGGPGWFFQLQNYNVPLIVMASAMALSHARIKEKYVFYVWKRIKRLIFPAWLFLTGYFLFLKITGLDPKHLTFQHIVDNYTLTNAGGFMWIIRVFVLVALIAPVIDQFDRKIKSNTFYLGTLLVAYVLYEGLLYFSGFSHDGIIKEFFDSYVDYAIAYGLIFALGLRLRKLSSKELWVVGGLSFAVFVALCGLNYSIEGHFVQTQAFKYPPSAYYVSYAVAASLATWALAGSICGFLAGYSWLEAAVMFIAQNSLWVYFWHTLYLFVSYRMHDQSFLLKYLVVYGLSVLTVLAQVRIVKKLLLPRIHDEQARKEITGLLTG